MEAIIELIKLTGCGILLFAVGYTFACISGYGEFYDKILYDDDDDIDLIIKNYKNDNDDNEDNDDDIIRSISFRN